jgi:hypothetical protein
MALQYFEINQNLLQLTPCSVYNSQSTYVSLLCNQHIQGTVFLENPIFLSSTLYVPCSCIKRKFRFMEFNQQMHVCKICLTLSAHHQRVSVSITTVIKVTYKNIMNPDFLSKCMVTKNTWNFLYSHWISDYLLITSNFLNWTLSDFSSRQADHLCI